MKYCFLVNPAAGKGTGAKPLAEQIEAVCSEENIDFEIYFTNGVGSATVYVKEKLAEYSNTDITFFACGGDGTLGEVTNGVMSCPERRGVYVGVMPVGTGNDFVRNFSNPDGFLDVKKQLIGSPMKIDVIDCNGIYSVNMVNIGFDCEVVCKKEAWQEYKIIPSKLAYIIGLAVTLIRKPGIKCEMSFDGGEYEKKDLLLTTFGNGEFCGGGFHSNPEAAINNGKINVLTVNNISRIKFVSIVGKYKKGTHLSLTNILDNRNVKAVDIRFDKPTHICVDGEVIKIGKELRMKRVNKAVSFIVPHGIKYTRELAAEKATV